MRLKKFVRTFCIGVILSQLLFGAGVSDCYAQAAINPVTSVNYLCLFPISIGVLSTGTSLNVGADLFDAARSKMSGVLCLCPVGPYEVDPGIPMGLTTPSHILETTTEVFKFPSLNMVKGGAFFRMGGSDSPDQKNTKNTFTHSHLHQFSVLKLLDIFQDTICSRQGGGFDILYMSEVDPTANSSNTAMLLFPETVLIANPIAAMACAVDAVATFIGLTVDPMYWCAGGHSVFPLSNYTLEETSYEDSSSITMVKMMYRMNRMSAGSNFGMTAGPLAVKACRVSLISPLVIKSQYRIQTAVPFVGPCERLGAPPIKWNTPKRSNIAGDVVNILWTREDCCAL
ncbi:MAG: TraU family protein [Deferribacteraceae bacterium]|jgi:conjugal transfer pilus assembly protein TraU|nr:TraU family protein [Deferribacteraceae bacterium]